MPLVWWWAPECSPRVTASGPRKAAQIIGNLRNDAAVRRTRNDAVVLALMSTELPLQAQDSIRRSRDALRTAMKLVTNEGTPENDRLMIREALGRLVRNEPSS